MTVGPLLIVVVRGAAGVEYILVVDLAGADLGADLKELPPTLPPLLAAIASYGDPVIITAAIIIASMEPLNHSLFTFLSGSGSLPSGWAYMAIRLILFPLVVLTVEIA